MHTHTYWIDRGADLMSKDCDCDIGSNHGPGPSLYEPDDD